MQGTQYGCDKERHRDSKIRPGSPWEQDAMAPQLVCVATTKQPRGHRVWTVFSRRPKSLNYQGQGRVVGAIKRFNLARFSAGPCNKVPTPSHGRGGETCSTLVPTDCHLTTLNNVCCTSIYRRACSQAVRRSPTSDTPADWRLCQPVSPCDTGDNSPCTIYKSRQTKTVNVTLYRNIRREHVKTKKMFMCVLFRVWWLG